MPDVTGAWKLLAFEQNLPLGPSLMSRFALAIFCVLVKNYKVGNFLQACKFLNSLQFSAIFPLLYKIYENCEKSEGWWFFAIICDFRSSLICYVAHQVESQIRILLILQKILRSMIFWPDKISISSCKFYNSCSYVQTWTCLPSLGVKIRLDFAWWVSTMCLVHILLNHVELLLHF